MLTAWLEVDAADLKLVEGVERAAREWARNGRLEAWLDHRGDRLTMAEGLGVRQDLRKRLGEEGSAYLAACRGRDEAERRASEEALAREQARLSEIAVANVRMLAELAVVEQARGNPDGAVRLAIHAARLDFGLSSGGDGAPHAGAALAAIAWQSGRHVVLPSGPEGPRKCAFSSDGSKIVTSSNENVHIWDRETLRETATLPGNTYAVSPDGSMIVTVLSDNTSRIWNAATAEEIAVLSGHEDQVSSAGFSPDGQRIITTSQDKTARIWDAATAKQIVTLAAHGMSVHSAAFSADGSRVMTTSMVKTVRTLGTRCGSGTPRRRTQLRP
jgi:WD domain, G-beta repeat